MSKLKKIKNGEYIGGDKYTITPEASGKSKVVFNPDSVITEPTPVGEEVLNEMQLNGTYTLNTNRIVDGQKEVYIATLEGFTEFDNPDLNLILKINSNNSSNNVYLRLNNIDYQILNCGIGNLISGRFTNAKKEGNFIKLLSLEKTDLTENDSNKVFTPKGALNLFNTLTTNFTNAINTAKEALRVDIARKFDKDGGIMTGPLTLPSDRYYASNNVYAMDLKNSDVIGINGLYFADTASGVGEGLMFPKKEVPTNNLDDYHQFYVNYEGNPYINKFKLYHQGFKPNKTDVGLDKVDNTSDSNKDVSTATKLKTARNITIGNKTYTFDGSINISYKLIDIGAVDRSGDTMNGQLIINKDGEGVVLNPVNGNTCVYMGKINNTNKFMIGKNTSSDEIILHSYDYNTNIKLKSDRVESNKNIYVGSNKLMSCSGDTMTGPLTMPANRFYGEAGIYSMNFRNSDAIGLNGLYFADSCDAVGEGLMFPKTNSPTNDVSDYFQFCIKSDGNPYVDNNIIYNSKNHKFIPIVGNHTYAWDSSPAASNKKYMGGVHFEAQDNSQQYLAFGASGSQKLDFIIDGEYYCNDGRFRVYNEGFKPKMLTTQIFSGWFVPNTGNWSNIGVNISDYDYITIVFSLNGSSWDTMDTRTFTLSGSSLKKGCVFYMSLTQGGHGNSNYEAMRVQAVNGLLQFANYGTGYTITNNGILQIWGDKI